MTPVEVKQPLNLSTPASLRLVAYQGAAESRFTASGQGPTISTVEATRLEASLRLRDLLLRTAEGSRAAFAEFYELTVSRILGVVRRCLVDPAQSEEVTQDVYLEIWQRAAKYDESRGSALAWVMVIAHRRAVDRVRASQSSRSRDLAIGLRDRSVEYDSVSETVEVRLEHDRALVAMNSLTALQREAIELAYFHGLTYAEISDRLGLSMSTVKTRLRDGLIRMRKTLTPVPASV